MGQPLRKPRRSLEDRTSRVPIDAPQLRLVGTDDDVVGRKTRPKGGQEKDILDLVYQDRDNFLDLKDACTGYFLEGNMAGFYHLLNEAHKENYGTPLTADVVMYEPLKEYVLKLEAERELFLNRTGYTD